MAVTALCTSADLGLRLSAAGVNLRVDDDAAGTTWAIRRGSVDVYSYCQRYTQAQLQASDVAKEIAADVSTYYLCLRRANSVPKSIQALYDTAMAWLLSVQSGAINIYDIAERKENAPVLSNVTTDLYPRPRTVVDKELSTGTVDDYRQNLPTITLPPIR